MIICFPSAIRIKSDADGCLSKIHKIHDLNTFFLLDDMVDIEQMGNKRTYEFEDSFKTYNTCYFVIDASETKQDLNWVRHHMFMDYFLISNPDNIIL